MIELIKKEFGPFDVTLTPELAKADLGPIIMSLAATPDDNTRALEGNATVRPKVQLGGRGPIAIFPVDGIGGVVVKHYTRGGVWGKIVRKRYFRIGKGRSEREFNLLLKAKEVGVNVPDPLGFAETRFRFYRAWLFTREIPSQTTLIELGELDDERLKPIIEDLVRQVVLLIQNKILHIDLHPGNILVSEDGKVFLLDFDKAHDFSGAKTALRDYYLSRWRRAIIKHGLPEILAELMSVGLRRNYGW